MNLLLASLWAEGLKIRKSKILWITISALAVAPLMGGFFMFVLKNPELAEASGLLGAKAQLAGESNWPSYFSLLAQTIAVGGILVFGFVTSWVFGREYSDRTAKDLLALPIPRALIVAAKFIAVIIWCTLLSLIVFVLGLLIGTIIDLPKWSFETAVHGFYVLAISSLLTMVLSTPVAFFASFGRGYLAPLGFVVVTLVFAQIIAAIGHGYYFPWSIPAIYSNIAGTQGDPIGLVSYMIVCLTGMIGVGGTLAWWQFADQV